MLQIMLLMETFHHIERKIVGFQLLIKISCCQYDLRFHLSLNSLVPTHMKVVNFLRKVRKMTCCIQCRICMNLGKCASIGNNLPANTNHLLLLD